MVKKSKFMENKGSKEDIKIKKKSSKKEGGKETLKKNKEVKILPPQRKTPEQELIQSTQHEDTKKIIDEREIAMDFAAKVYKKYDKMIKSIVMFGSSAKKTANPDSDIDVVIIIDDVSIKWDEELIGWYRGELGKLIQKNPYMKSLHINTVKLSTWWADLIKGDPTVINVIRYGDPLIDFGGFFSPLKILLKQGQIKSTPEAIYTLLQRAPTHMLRTKTAILSAVDGLYWAMVDSAHAALIAAGETPPSPEDIAEYLKLTFVDRKMLKMNYVEDYINIHYTAKEIIYGHRTEVYGKEIDEWIVKTDDFLKTMAELIDRLIEMKDNKVN